MTRLVNYRIPSFLSAIIAVVATAITANAEIIIPPTAEGEHPLVPALKVAHEGIKHIDANIQDYSATLVKRERIKGELVGPEYMYLKVRHKPFSVYMYFLKPDDYAGREVMYIDGQNNGKIWAHEGKGIRAKFGTVSLRPDSPMAMQNQRYPITLIGIRTLTQRLIEQGENDLQYGECEVKYFHGAKINGRVCTVIQSTHPTPRKHFRYHLARIFIDDELEMPIRYAAYMWSGNGGKPVLDEEYTYMNVKINNGFTDADFDIHNPKYQFVKRKKRWHCDHAQGDWRTFLRRFGVKFKQRPWRRASKDVVVFLRGFL